MPVERASGGTSLIDVLDRVLDKGIVIDAWVRVSLVGIDLLTVEARVVVASIDTYIKYSEAVVAGRRPVSRPSHRVTNLRRISWPRTPRSAPSSPPPTPAEKRLPARRGGAARRPSPPSGSRGPRHPLLAAIPSCTGSDARLQGQARAGRRPAWSSRRPGRARSWRCAGWPATPGSSAACASVVESESGAAGRPDRHRDLAAAVDPSLGPRRPHPSAGRRARRLRAGRLPRQRRPGPAPAPFETPLGSRPFHAVPLSAPNDSGDLGPGLLLVTPAATVRHPRSVRWAAEVLGVRLSSLWYRRSQVDERRHKRERSWLFGIINAVTDPILLTDSDGRILVANAGAEMLLTADDQKSEGAAARGGAQQHAVLGLGAVRHRERTPASRGSCCWSIRPTARTCSSRC